MVLQQHQQQQLQIKEHFIIKFVQSIDVPAAARTLGTLLTDIGNAMAFVGRFATPLAENLLPAIGGYLAFINRQAIASSVAGLASAFAASARAALGYSAAAGAAATATVGLGVAIRGLLASTGIGLLVVGLGLAAGAALEWAIASDSASTDSAAAIAEAEAARPQALKEASGLGALQGMQALVQPGGLIRGIAGAGAAFGSTVAKAKEADRIEKRALASMQLNLADAQRKERMGMTRSAVSAASEAIKDKRDAERNRLKVLEKIGRAHV